MRLPMMVSRQCILLPRMSMQRSCRCSLQRGLTKMRLTMKVSRQCTGLPGMAMQPSKGININVSLHITIHTGVLIKTIDGGWRHGALEWQHSAEAQGDDPWSEATRLVGRRRTEATSSYVVPPQGAYVCRSRGAWPYGMPHRFGPQRPRKGMNINGYCTLPSRPVAYGDDRTARCQGALVLL